jgi:hypothetical protein
MQQAYPGCNSSKEKNMGSSTQQSKDETQQVYIQIVTIKGHHINRPILHWAGLAR